MALLCRPISWVAWLENRFQFAPRSDCLDRVRRCFYGGRIHRLPPANQMDYREAGKNNSCSWRVVHIRNDHDLILVQFRVGRYQRVFPQTVSQPIFLVIFVAVIGFASGSFTGRSLRIIHVKNTTMV